MSIKNKFGEIKNILLYSLSTFFILGLLYLMVMLTIKVNSDKVIKNDTITNEESVVDVEKTIISNKVNRLITDVLYISDSLRLCDSTDFTDIEKQWLAFSDRKEIYDQIRYIDLDGNELIRINYSEAGSYVTSKNELQNKKDRYYFTDTISLHQNQIYISKLDLNVENNEVEQPIKPMIRLSTPYYGEDGKLNGIVILNYYAKDLLQQVSKIASTSQGDIFMLNANGYWIYNGEDSNKEWGFMYEDKLDESFQSQFPDEWNSIKNNKNGLFITSNGILSYSNILTSEVFSVVDSKNSIVLGEGDWYIVSYIAPDSQKGMIFSQNFIENIVVILKTNIFAFILILFIAIVFAILMTMNKIEKDKIKYFSEYDTMTGVYNRRAGFEKLNKIYKDLPKDNGVISICFIDINGLKDVNDHLGHEAGDELILSVIQGIKLNIRDIDFVSRLGGDEFLIIFNRLNELEAEKIWIRINEEYKKINETQGRKYIISASHGIEEFKFNTSEYIDTIINLADEKMYNEKRIIKRDFKVIR